MNSNNLLILYFESHKKVHISFAITMAVEGFYPKNSAGYTIASFSSFNQALPLVTLIISMIASSIGMTKFFLQGPIPILPKNSPINGLISLPFISTLLINSMYGIRLICIESSLFTLYRYQRYFPDKIGTEQKTIEPIIPPEYRLLAYLAPGFLSFMINTIRLCITKAKLRENIRKYPQYLIACMFTPFMFEGSNDKTIQIWKRGTIVNAFFIGFIPQILLIIMDYYRGISSWNFIGIALRTESIWEINDALFKHRYGNSMFAVISGIICLLLIIFTFFTDKIFKNHGIYCKTFTILCLPCPNNCVNLNPKSSPSLSLPIKPHLANDDSHSGSEKLNCDEAPMNAYEPSTQIYVYSKKIRTYLTGNPLVEQEIALETVSVYKYFQTIDIIVL